MIARFFFLAFLGLLTVVSPPPRRPYRSPTSTADLGGMDRSPGVQRRSDQCQQRRHMGYLFCAIPRPGRRPRGPGARRFLRRHLGL